MNLDIGGGTVWRWQPTHRVRRLHSYLAIPATSFMSVQQPSAHLFALLGGYVTCDHLDLHPRSKSTQIPETPSNSDWYVFYLCHYIN